MKPDSVGRGALRLAPALALGFTGLIVSSSLVWGVGVSDLMRRYGLDPVDPPRPAADFELPRIGGGVGSLSDFAGGWTVLTFWASWCGPCRAEMPSLEQIHRGYGQKGVIVLGVSVDSTEAAAQAFIAEHGLTFPQLWDRGGRVGAIYKATAIPLSYLVDPRGRIVASARGARDWTRMVALIEALAAELEVGTAVESAYAEAVDLASVVDPPTAEVILSDPSPEVGEPFSVDVRLHWAGRGGDYLPQPPRLLLPEGIVEKGVTASSSSREGSQIVVYRIDLQADRSGEFALDPIELRYQLELASEVATSRVKGPTITVAPRSVLGWRVESLAVAAGAAMLMAALGIVVSRRRRSRRQPEIDVELQQFEDLSARYSTARELRLQGDGAGAALAMLEILRQLEQPADEVTAARARLAEGLRFGGQRPTMSELDRLERQVSRGIESLRPDPATAARAALQLHEDEEIA